MHIWNPDLIHTLRIAVVFATISLVMNLLTLRAIREILERQCRQLVLSGSTVPKAPKYRTAVFFSKSPEFT